MTDNTARLWDLQGNELTNFGNLDNIYEIKFSPNGQFLITRLSWFSKKSRLWDLQGNELTNFSNLDDIKKINFSPNGQLLVTIHGSNEIKLQVTDKVTGKSNTQNFKLLTYNDFLTFQRKLINWLIRFGFINGTLVFLVFPGGYLFARWIAKHNSKPPDFPGLPKLEKEISTAISTLNQELEDEVQVAQAVHQGIHKDTELPLTIFTDTSEYFPVTSRQMKQSWRYLRRLVREGPLTEIDVKATVQQISRERILLHPVLRSRRVNRNELLLLVDQDGSMVPFHALSERLAKTAIHGGRLSKAGIYYFHNCPNQYLYQDPYHQIAEPISEVLSGLHSEYTGILIFSDAGAARGAFNPERLKLTTDFLAQLQQKFRYIAWLNPLPRDRWIGTAGEIAKLVPMFPLSRQGLNQAINVLRAKPIHQTV